MANRIPSCIQSHILRYIDDLVTGCSSLVEAKTLRYQIVTMIGRAKLELHKWSSNNPALLEDIPPEHQHQAHSVSFDNSPSSSIKVLGL